MYDLVLVLILHLALLQLLGRRLPTGQEAETRSPRERRLSSPMTEETARQMIDRAYPPSCSDAHDDGRSSTQER